MFCPRKPTGYKKFEGKTSVMKFEAEPNQIVEKHTDDRGRLTLGTEYSDQKVKVLILDE